MKQTAHIAKTRGWLLVELLYIHLPASRLRQSSCCRKVSVVIKHQLTYHTTHLSAAKVSFLNNNSLVVTKHNFFVIEFCDLTP